MERLTERGGKYICVKGCTTHYADVERKGANHANAIVRLAAYEDTGLTPEEITDIIEMFHSYRHICAGLEPQQVEVITQAKKDGRLVVLPCQVGDIVYEVSDGKVVGQTAEAFAVTAGQPHKLWINVKDDRYCIVSTVFGRIFFTSREEAKAALKRMEEKENETD